MKITLVILLILLTTLIAPPAFASNRVLSLDGDGDYVEIAPNENLNSINSQATIEAWIKAEVSPKYWLLIIYKGDEVKPNFSNRSYVLILFHYDDTFHLASAPSGRRNVWINASHNLIKLNRWYHIAGVIDAKKNVIRMFINGFEAGSREFGDSIHVSALPLRIGWTHEDDPRYSSFAGQIDEVRIWRIARSQEEIQGTMHATLSGKEPGLVGYWRFDDVGKIATDSSEYHSDGKLIGDAHFVEAEFPTSDEIFVPTVLSGKITDEAGRPVVAVFVRLLQDERERVCAETDTSGNYKIVILGKVHGLYNLTVTQNDIDWRFSIWLREGEHRTLSPYASI